MSGSESMARRKPMHEAALHGSIRDDQVAVLTPSRVRRAPTLDVGAVHDAAEHEADRLAERVVARLREQEADGGVAEGVRAHAHSAPSDVRRMAAPTIGSEGGPVSAELADQIEGMRGRGDALDETTRRRMGEGFGADLSSVRVHTDERAASAASAMGALAFTTGNDIFFGAGQYRPDDAAGQQVLAHELAHTVQQRGGARRKVSRLWDLSRMDSVDISSTARITVLEERNVMFMQDDSGDTMVLKLDDQPIALGALVGQMQKKLAAHGTISYLKLPPQVKGTLAVMLDQRNLLNAESWAKKGRRFNSDPMFNQILDPVDRGVAIVKADLTTNTSKQLVAMGVAPGESAEASHERQADDPNSLKSRLERPGHLRELGRMTAVDLLVGNEDRLLSGNLGNWFYDPSGSMVAIDNVDGSEERRMAPNFKAGEVTTDQLLMLADGALATTAKAGVDALLGSMLARPWGNQNLPNGKKRRDVFEADLIDGLKEGKKQIGKVFASSRWKGSKSNHQTKKALKKYANTAAAIDADVDGEAPYYATLKARAAWLRKH